MCLLRIFLLLNEQINPVDRIDNDKNGYSLPSLFH
jgi:hypothetical protein